MADDLPTIPTRMNFTVESDKRTAYHWAAKTLNTTVTKICLEALEEAHKRAKLKEAAASVAKENPTLNTVLMVEKVLKEAGEVISVAELKRRLPKQVMHSTIIQIIDYLQLSGKILITTKGILWVFKERAELEKMTREGL